MAKKHVLGQQGELVASLFLQMCGYSCLATNFRRPGGELDLIMAREQELVFVEVKTRGINSLAPAEHFVSRLKLKRMRNTARIWLFEHPEHRGQIYRFDVVAVEFQGQNSGLAVRHYQGI